MTASNRVCTISSIEGDDWRGRIEDDVVDHVCRKPRLVASSRIFFGFFAVSTALAPGARKCRWRPQAICSGRPQVW